MATRLASTLIWVVPLLLLLAYPSTAQSVATATAPNDGPVCLNEILISTPKSYDPSQVADAQRKAEGALVAIQQGAKFEDVAKNYSDGPTAANGGALGPFKRGQLSKKIEDKVFAMKVGDVSDVIRTKQGFTIVQVTGCSVASQKYGSPGSIEILSDTKGVDFGPYLQRLRDTIQQNWFRLIPTSAEQKKGKVVIQFDVTNEGKVKDMRLVATSGDRNLDRPAWGSITASDPFPPLPTEFTGPYLTLRFRFFYNPDKSDFN
jgi:TonB family protein